MGLSVGYAPIEMTKPGGVQTFSPETDVYSLGATLYYLVTGQNPPDASERMEMIMEGEKFQLPDIISNSTAEVIEQSMQARKKRIQNVNGFMELLNSDGEKRRLEAEEKAAKEAEAKRQEALRIEREKEEAEKKRIAEEERARMDAEVKIRKETTEKAEESEKAQRDGKTNKWLIGLNVFFLIAGLVMFVLALANVLYNPWPSSFNPFGYIGFGLLCCSLVFSLVCLSRKTAKGLSAFSAVVSFLIGIVCLYDAVDEDSLVMYPFGTDFCEPYSFSRDIFVSKAYYDNSNITSITNNTVSFSLSTEASVNWFPFKMPTDVFLGVGSLQDTEGPTVSTMLQSKYHISNQYSTNSPYFLIDGNTLTIYNLSPGTKYYVFFYLPNAIQSYGVFESLEYSVWANLKVYSFQTSNNWY